MLWAERLDDGLIPVASETLNCALGENNQTMNIYDKKKPSFLKVS